MVTILPTIGGPIGRFELDDPGDVRAEVYRDLVMRRGDDGWFRWQTAFDPIPGCADRRSTTDTTTRSSATTAPRTPPDPGVVYHDGYVIGSSRSAVE